MLKTIRTQLKQFKVWAETKTRTLKTLREDVENVLRVYGREIPVHARDRIQRAVDSRTFAKFIDNIENAITLIDIAIKPVSPEFCTTLAQACKQLAEDTKNNLQYSKVIENAISSMDCLADNETDKSVILKALFEMWDEASADDKIISENKAKIKQAIDIKVGDKILYGFDKFFRKIIKVQHDGMHVTLWFEDKHETFAQFWNKANLITVVKKKMLTPMEKIIKMGEKINSTTVVFTDPMKYYNLSQYTPVFYKIKRALLLSNAYISYDLDKRKFTAHGIDPIIARVIAWNIYETMNKMEY